MLGTSLQLTDVSLDISQGLNVGVQELFSHYWTALGIMAHNITVIVDNELFAPDFLI